MQLGELVLKMSGVDSWGLYDSDDKPIQVESDGKALLENQDKEIRHTHVFIYDYDDKDIFGNKIECKGIRCCVYLIA